MIYVENKDSPKVTTIGTKEHDNFLTPPKS